MVDLSIAMLVITRGYQLFQYFFGFLLMNIQHHHTDYTGDFDVKNQGLYSKHGFF